MKKIEKSLIKKYRPTFLCLEDLELIEAILKETSSDVKIFTNDYQYDSLEELKKSNVKIPLTNIKISSQLPHISIELSSRDAYLYSSNSDNKSTGIFWKLDKCLTDAAKLGPLSFILTFWFSFLFMLLIGLLLNILHTLSLIDLKTITAIFIAALGVYALVGYITMKKHSQISLNHRGSIDLFWDKNKDSLLIQIIAGSIILFIGYLLGKIK